MKLTISKWTKIDYIYISYIETNFNFWFLRETGIGYDFELTSIYIFTEVEKFRILQKVSDSNSSFDD